MTKNERAIIRTLYELDGATRLSVARRADLSVVLVSSVLTNFMKRGIVKYDGMSRKPMGRPSTVYRLSPDFGYATGISIDADSVRIVTLSAGRKPLFDTAKAVNFTDIKNTDAMLEVVFSILDTYLEDCSLPPERIRALGLAVPGAVLSSEGLWQEGLRITGIHNLNIGEIFRQRYSLPVIVQDMARAITYYEKEMGSAKGYENFVLLHVGEGVGAGIVINGRLYEGAHGFPGEIGHLTVFPQGVECRCGKRGCLETVISESGILRSFSERFGNFSPEVSSIDEIAARAKAGDEKVCLFLSWVGENIGKAVVVLSALFDPDAVVISGSCSILSPFIEEAVRTAVKRETMPSMAGKVALLFSDYSFNQEAAGAALLAFHQFWDEFS